MNICLSFLFFFFFFFFSFFFRELFIPEPAMFFIPRVTTGFFFLFLFLFPLFGSLFSL